MRKPLIGGLITFFVICAAVICVLSWNLRECHKGAGILRDDLEASRDSLAKARDALTTQNETVEYEPETLKELGLTDPVHQLRSDLMAHRDLIPFEGVLGGVMGFYRPQDILILNASWAFARFEDGHISGSCLLEYSVNPDKSIHWRVIKAKKD